MAAPSSCAAPMRRGGGRTRLWATPLFAALVAVEAADVVFAVDGVPAALLVFIGGKMLVAEALGIHKVPPALSLGVTALILGAGLAWLLISSRDTNKA